MRKPVMPSKGWDNKPRRKKRGMKGFRQRNVKASSRSTKSFRHMGRRQ